MKISFQLEIIFLLKNLDLTSLKHLIFSYDLGQLLGSCRPAKFKHKRECWLRQMVSEHSCLCPKLSSAQMPETLLFRNFWLRIILNIHKYFNNLKVLICTNWLKTIYEFLFEHYSIIALFVDWNKKTDALLNLQKQKLYFLYRMN